MYADMITPRAPMSIVLLIFNSSPGCRSVDQDSYFRAVQIVILVSHSSCPGKGFYRAEGLDVDYVIMKPQVAMQALIAGDVGYTTALGSTIRAALRNVPFRVVMTIADKPLFALIAQPGIHSVEELRESCSASHPLARARTPTRARCCADTS